MPKFEHFGEPYQTDLPWFIALWGDRSHFSPLRSQCETSIPSQGLCGADWTGNRLDLLPHQQISVGDLPKWYKDLPVNQQVHYAYTEPGLQTALGLVHYQTGTKPRH